MDQKLKKSIEIVGNKWVLMIMAELLSANRRFGELYRAVEGITQKMLTQKLRQLEKEGLLSRKVYAEVPPRVEYSLTATGIGFGPVLTALVDWGKEYKALPVRPVKKTTQRKPTESPSFDPSVD